MTTQVRPGSRPWWSYAALSVRGLIALMVVIAAALAWFSIPASAQRDAVRAIEESGGKVWYDSQPEATPVVRVPTRLRPGEQESWMRSLARSASAWRQWVADSLPHQPPGWLIDAVGIDYFNNVISVSLTHRATDVELTQVARLQWVERLDIHGSSVTASGLARLQALPILQTLLLVRTKVGDAGLAQIAGMKNLRVLSLEGTEFTDQGLALLDGLAGLEDLDLASTGVTDDGLAHLKGWTRLRELTLSRTAITDSGLAHIESLTGLQELALDRTKVTSAGMKHLKGLVNLVELTLDRTGVSDDGLSQIEGLDQIATLSLGRTKVSDAAVAQFQLNRATRLANQAALAKTATQQPPKTIPKLEIMH